MKKLLFIFLVFSLLPLSLGLTVMHVPAVDANGEGVLTTIEATATAGTGGVYVDIEPFISVDTQNSAKVAAKVAAAEAGVKLDDYNVMFKIIADTEIVDGPSGGSALALLAYSEFSGRKLRNDLALTGTIEPDASVGKIGGVLQKAEAASKAGVKLFLVPSGQSKQGGVDLTQYAERWGMQVVEVSNFDDVIKYAFTPAGSQVQATRKEEVPLSLIQINSSSETQEMKGIAQNQIDELKRTSKKYEKENSNESKLISAFLLQSINTSEYMLEQGYYYSAANTAFLAQVNERAFSLANVSNSEFKQMIADLEKQALEMKFANKTLENLDWTVGGQLRYYWALQTIYDLKERSDVIAPIQLVEDYASAETWLSAAKSMNAIAERKGGSPVDELKARDYALQFIEAVNASLNENLLDTEVLQHADAAVLAFTNGDYITSTFDSSFAQAIVSARQKMSKADSPQALQQLANSDPARANSFESVWAQLYYAHSLYSIQESNRTGEFAFLSNAIKLQEVSRAFESNLKQVQTELEKPSVPQASALPTAQLEIGIIEIKEQPVWLQPKYVILGSVVAIIIAIIIGILVVRSKVSQRTKPLAPEDREKKLDDLLIKGEISETTYQRLMRKYAPEEKPELRRKRKATR